MRIESLLQVIQPITVRGSRNADVRSIDIDSRRVRPGSLFVALPGRHVDGTRFIQEAIDRGAVAIVTEKPIGLRRDVALIHVEDARRALAEIACAFYDHPSGRLTLAGITGTNGKTTTAFMLRDLLRAGGRRPGLLGTVSYEIGARRIPAGRTTPEAPDVQSMLDQMVQAGCDSAVMEVSSHALDQKRVWGVDFDVGLFTNLTQDHLDYHGDLETYFAAKALLFRGLGQMQKAASAIINLDDPWGRRLAAIGGCWSDCVTYGEHPASTVRASDIRVHPAGSFCRVSSPWGDWELNLTVLGRFNVSNALAAFAAGGTLGLDPRTMATALSRFSGAPGRIEEIRGRRDFRVFVDYAHTDDALQNVLTSLRELEPRRLIVVFGCGGDRDRGKRPLMGAVAARLADLTVLTSDNPRTEDPEAILKEIRSGIPAGAPVESVTDREAAIRRAFELAGPGDLVLIAGKGHENVQEFERTIVPFDDREVARRLMG
ncbi:MAG: UDP-N-acetylmuramoyl-L-alanyl-D-glutamate--2,6-diaminopimelate ligase [Kiritimatiellia bacterium]|nr:UDP-N-acetylmuramoyl-L-alanyl-D-glutamate--2,6-diaminopimelate ligase [Kiritimatiellia bacterium]